MKRIAAPSLLLFLFVQLLPGQADYPEATGNWPKWRGPFETGVAPGGNPPITWGEGRNIRWKTDIPGTGNATPIVWEEQVILLSAVKTDVPARSGESNMNQQDADFIHKFQVISVDRNSGKIKWATTVREEAPFSQTHEYGSWASNSPVTDGEHIFAYFGSHGLYCLKMDGTLVWERDLGRMEKVMNFGEGSSPSLFREKLILLRDHEGPSSLLALDKSSGRTIWEVGRDEISSWATPLIVTFRGNPQVVTSATNKVRSYSIDEGELLWECTGMTRNVIPSPMYADGMVYLLSGYRGNSVMAIDLSKASGDLSGTDAIVWKYEMNTPYTPCGILMDGRIYFLKTNNGYLTCLDAKNGREYYSSARLEGISNIFTSPVAVRDRIYIVGTNGTTCVVQSGDSFKILAQNNLEDEFYASPVISGDELLIRGVHSLYCISADRN